MSKKENDIKNQEPEEAQGIPETEEAVETFTEPAAGEEKREPSQAELLAAEKERFLRLAAEYDNYRKRSQKERDSIFNMVKTEMIIRFLPVYDNLERALGLKTADEAFCKGIEMTMVQFKEILSNLGVVPIDAVGKKFDANLHNAFMHVEDDTKGEQEIVEEIQKGFMLGDKVIRFSMVKVAN